MEKIEKRFHAVHALNGVDFELRAGEIHVLLGQNGAGKSTLIKILSGAEQMDSGAIFVNGTPTVIRSPIHARELGICTVYQEFVLIPQLTVAENILLGRRVLKRGVVDWSSMYRRAKEILDRLGFDISVRERVGRLSVHQQQVVEIARALAHDAKILVLDEPTAALSGREIERLFEILNGLRKERVGIVYISHNLEEVERIGDRATVLRDGRTVATVDLQTTSIDELPRLMIGQNIKEPFPKLAVERGDVVLRVTACSDADHRFRDVNFELHAGEIVSFAGLLGSGNESFVRALLGLGRRPSGGIELHGKPYRIDSPATAIGSGFFYLPADRKSEGLVPSMSVLDNSTLASLRRFLSGGILSIAKQREDSRVHKDKLDIKTASLATRSRNLSGGNQQKVMIARALSAKSKVIIFNEPTRGVDIKGKVEIYRLLSQLAAEGAGIIFISQELSEMIGISDRIMIWRDGAIIQTLDQADATKEKVLSLITGA
jgi:ribose transport system ATP-binding protein